MQARPNQGLPGLALDLSVLCGRLLDVQPSIQGACRRCCSWMYPTASVLYRRLCGINYVRRKLAAPLIASESKGEIMSQHPNTATVTVSAFNSNPAPPVKQIQFANDIFPNGDGQLSTARIQFNVNRESTGGAVFVNERNQGAVVLSISSEHVFLNGWAVVMPDGSWTDGAHKPHDIDSCVSISRVIESNKKLTFFVHRVGALEGNVTMTFFATYRAAA